ncbi:DctP family TRAP transporter solute-binding subunit [Magnetococcales bacterium HHB-1]
MRIISKLDVQSEISANIETNQTLRLGLNIPRGTALHAAAERYAERISEQTAGRLKIEVYPNQELGNDNQMLEMARRGELTIVLTPTAKLTTAVPAMQVLDLPFFFSSKQVLYQALDGEFGRILLRKLRDIGLVGVTFWENGFKHFTANVPLRTPDDFNGLKFRIMKSRIIQKQFEALGAETLPIDFHATQQALADGIVDGQENPLVAIVAMKFYEVQKHLTLSEHAYLGYALSFSQKRLKHLSTEDQKILFTTAREITNWEREETQRREEAFLERIERAGVMIHRLDQRVRANFKSVLSFMSRAFEEDIGVDIISLAQEVMALNGRQDRILIGLNADLSQHSALVGLAIKRGAQLAIHEINQVGGVLGRKLALMARDHQNNGQRGRDNIRFFSGFDNLIAIIGGKRSPVIKSELDLINSLQIPYMIPWAAAADLTAATKKPNFVFRVSLNDTFAARYLIETAFEHGKRVSVVFEKTTWGEGNHRQMHKYTLEQGKELAGGHPFDVGHRSFSSIIQKLFTSQTDSLVLISNPHDGQRFMTELLAVMPDIRVVSHWGILSGRMPKEIGALLEKNNTLFPQTIFLWPPVTKAGAQILSQYQRYFRSDGSLLEGGAAGFAHAYDIVHLLVKALHQAKSINRRLVRDALEQLPPHNGLVKRYEQAFLPDRHDALALEDYHLGRFVEGSGVVPFVQEDVHP